MSCRHFPSVHFKILVNLSVWTGDLLLSSYVLLQHAVLLIDKLFLRTTSELHKAFIILSKVDRASSVFLQRNIVLEMKQTMHFSKKWQV